MRLYEMGFQILSVTGTLTRATATYRVTSFKHHQGGPTLHTSQVGKLLLRDGIVRNALTEDYFCSDPAWGATGACGAYANDVAFVWRHKGAKAREPS